MNVRIGVRADNSLNIENETFANREAAVVYWRQLRRQIDALWPAPKKPKPAKVEPPATDIERLREKLGGGLL